MIQISNNRKAISGKVLLPASKSIYNRALVLTHLYTPNTTISAESESNDVRLMGNALKVVSDASKEADVVNIFVGDAGTVLRFILPVLFVKGGRFLIKGENRLMQRPHQDLLDSLISLGAKANFFADAIQFESSGIHERSPTIWKVDGTKSSQYATGLMMIAPSFPKPVTIEMQGSLNSMPYIDMTLGLMQRMGLKIHRKDNCIFSSPAHSVLLKEIKIEPDWSAASYLYAASILARESNLFLPGLSQDSLQGDKRIGEFAKNFGLHEIVNSKGINLHGTLSNLKIPNSIEQDYSNTPDLALTEIIVCHALGVPHTLTGVDSLSHKESDRLTNIRTELKKFDSNTLPVFECYNDHRMAMSLAVLSLIKPIIITDPEVVAKSFPKYWDVLQSIGFDIKEV